MARGYSAEDCRKILGGNLLRFFREVEAVSKQPAGGEPPADHDKTVNQWSVVSEQ